MRESSQTNTLRRVLCEGVSVGMWLCDVIHLTSMAAPVPGES